MTTADEPKTPAPTNAGGDLDDAAEIEASSAPLLDHLTELRRRLIVSMCAVAAGFVLCFIFSVPLYEFLVIPFKIAVGRVNEDPTLYFAPLEFFFTRVKLAFLGGIALAFPVVAYEIYQFVAPGLYKRERRAVLPFLAAMPVLFTAGGALVYYVLMPFVMSFAVGMEQQAAAGAGVTIELLTRVGDYLSLITTLIMAFGFAFQLPVFLTLLARAGLIDAGFLRRNRKYAIVGIFVVAAFLTPPDPVSQLVLGAAIIALYEVSVLSVSLAGRKAARDAEPAAAQ
ncbi:MAG: twin-arginine translocase subunit TatC [Pseudomonadota bacterium]